MIFIHQQLFLYWGLQFDLWDKENPVEDVMRTLNDLMRQGKIKGVSLTDLETWQLQKAKDSAEYMGLGTATHSQVRDRMDVTPDEDYALVS